MTTDALQYLFQIFNNQCNPIHGVKNVQIYHGENDDYGNDVAPLPIFEGQVFDQIWQPSQFCRWVRNSFPNGTNIPGREHLWNLMISKGRFILEHF